MITPWWWAAAEVIVTASGLCASASLLSVHLFCSFVWPLLRDWWDCTAMTPPSTPNVTGLLWPAFLQLLQAPP